MKNIILLFVLGFIISSCQTMPYRPYAREVKKKPKQNGVIALKPNYNEEDKNKAMMLMQSNCAPQTYNILEEGETVIGQEAVTNSNTSKNSGSPSAQVGSLFGIPVRSGGEDPSEKTSSTVTTNHVKEWQIVYECKIEAKKSTVR